MPSGGVRLTYLKWRMRGGGAGDIVYIRRYTPHYCVGTSRRAEYVVLLWLFSSIFIAQSVNKRRFCDPILCHGATVSFISD